ncbi:hypothetical protein V1517DRAFT_355445 [Lipomyces orientalis]|uniref:Uncharacterized protein n=1 Tax=Lipomyces orientalis TaxID=1233043 RepID=A0ACC3TDL1_9ASCO
MSSATIAYQCTECDHAPFDTKAKFNKHTSSKHRKAETFKFDGAAYPVVVADDGRYACPTCRTEASSISSLRRHMGRQNCGIAQAAGADDVQGWQNAVQDSGNENTATTAHTSITKDDCASLEGVGFKYNHYWDVPTCNRCPHVVDKSTIEDHLTNVHKLEIQDNGAMWRTIRAYRIRPHLAVVWDDKTELELDDSDDEYEKKDENSMTGFASGTYRPGAAAVDGVSVIDGYKCVQCESALQHRCVQSKEALRTHYKRKHANQAIVGQSTVAIRRGYREHDDFDAPEPNDITNFGIPANVHSVPGAHVAVAENRDMNQFGKAFFAYKLLEWLDLAELETLLHNPCDKAMITALVRVLRPQAPSVEQLETLSSRIRGATKAPKGPYAEVDASPTVMTTTTGHENDGQIMISNTQTSRTSNWEPR